MDLGFLEGWGREEGGLRHSPSTTKSSSVLLYAQLDPQRS
jgi:hypothetical protein